MFKNFCQIGHGIPEACIENDMHISSELRCTRLYLTGNFGLICWTEFSFCGNLVPTKGTSQRDYKLRIVSIINRVLYVLLVSSRHVRSKFFGIKPSTSVWMLATKIQGEWYIRPKWDNQKNKNHMTEYYYQRTE